MESNNEKVRGEKYKFNALQYENMSLFIEDKIKRH